MFNLSNPQELTLALTVIVLWTLIAGWRHSGRDSLVRSGLSGALLSFVCLLDVFYDFVWGNSYNLDGWPAFAALVMFLTAHSVSDIREGFGKKENSSVALFKGFAVVLPLLAFLFTFDVARLDMTWVLPGIFDRYDHSFVFAAIMISGPTFLIGLSGYLGDRLWSRDWSWKRVFPCQLVLTAGILLLFNSASLDWFRNQSSQLHLDGLSFTSTGQEIVGLASGKGLDKRTKSMWVQRLENGDWTRLDKEPDSSKTWRGQSAPYILPDKLGTVERKGEEWVLEQGSQDIHLDCWRIFRVIGHEIVFIRVDDKRHKQIFVLDARTKMERKTGDLITSRMWSNKASEEYVYYHDETHLVKLHILTGESQQLIALPKTRDGELIDPNDFEFSFSPDGSKLLSFVTSSKSVDKELTITDGESGRILQTSNLPEGEVDKIRWLSNDILYADHINEISISADLGKTWLKLPFETWEHPKIHPDHDRIYLQQGNHRIQVVDLQGNLLETIEKSELRKALKAQK